MVERVTKEPEGSSDPSESDDEEVGTRPSNRTMPVKEVFLCTLVQAQVSY